MITVSILFQRLAANRQCTLNFIIYLEALARHDAAVAAKTYAVAEARILHAQPLDRGGNYRGHIGWHLMHIAANEDASFGLTDRDTAWLRYQHGQSRSVATPPLIGIRQALETSRAGLLTLARNWDDELLAAVPPERQATGMTYREHLDSLAWHEAYHLNECNELLRAQFVE